MRHRSGFLLVFIICLLQAGTGTAQGFRKAAGGQGRELLSALSVFPNGDYLLAGSTTSVNPSEKDMYLVRMDSNGHKQWTRTFTRLGASETIMDAVTLSDGGVLFTGSWTEGWDPPLVQYDASCIVRLDPDGDIMWARYVTGRMTSCRQTSDGGFVVAGYAEASPQSLYDLALVRLDAAGNLVWSKTYTGGTGFLEFLYSVCETPDTGFLLAGRVTDYNNGILKALLVKTDHNGNVVWSRSYGDASASTWFWNAKVAGNGYVINGYSFDTGNLHTVGLLLRIDNGGNPIWQRSIHSAGPLFAPGISATSDGYILAGNAILHPSGPYQPVMLAVDTTGSLQWARTYPAADSMSIGLVAPALGGMLSAGSVTAPGKDRDLFLLRTDTAGISGCGDTSVTVSINPVVVPDSAILLINGAAPAISPITFTVDSTGTVNDICAGGTAGIDHQQTVEWAIYPNPAGRHLFVHSLSDAAARSIEVYTVKGQRLELPQENQGNRIMIDLESLTRGWYMLKIAGDKGVYKTGFIKN
ncbi:MAG: T9SS type A sorting domain-containing protein [Sphingobacteriales bacterium]|nr:MAG: T9SS type A sorting domain-containing protein [Sphingobacteriales bacterium]